MLYVLATVAALVGLAALAILVLRMRAAAGKRELREAIEQYVRSRGARIEFTPDGRSFTVVGPLGEGRHAMTVLEIMCTPDKRASWETSIGFVLRSYIPDKFDETFAKAAAADLAKLAPQIAALSEDELRSKLRAKIFGTRTAREGLAIVSKVFGQRHEARVVVDGFELAGIPAEARRRLAESDADLLQRALDASLGAPPSIDSGTASSQLWLCKPEAIFGAAPHIIVGEGQGLAWMSVTSDDVEERLHQLCRRSTSSGPLKCVLFAWDGAQLSDTHIVQHSIIGPNTPDYTLKITSAFHATLGIHPASDGSFGVRRPARR